MSGEKSTARSALKVLEKYVEDAKLIIENAYNKLEWMGEEHKKKKKAKIENQVVELIEEFQKTIQVFQLIALSNQGIYYIFMDR